MSSVEVPAKKFTAFGPITQLPEFGGLPAGGPPTVHVLVAPSNPSCCVGTPPIAIDVSSTNAPTPPVPGSVMYVIESSTCWPA